MRQALAVMWCHSNHHWRTDGKRWMLRVIPRGQWDLVAAIAYGFCCDWKRYFALITILPLKLSEAELVHAFPSADFAQDLLVVVITQRAAELLVCHVSSAIPLAPQISHIVGSYDGELSVSPLP